MSILIIGFSANSLLDDDNEYGPPPLTYYLEPTQANASFANVTLSVALDPNPLSSSPSHVVYRGKLYQNVSESGILTSAVDVVAKLQVDYADPVYRNKLEKEYKIYEGPLKDLQGSSVPKCKGLFRNFRSGETSDYTCCLLLEDCGDRLDQQIFLDDEDHAKFVLLHDCHCSFYV